MDGPIKKGAPKKPRGAPVGNKNAVKEHPKVTQTLYARPEKTLLSQSGLS